MTKQMYVYIVGNSRPTLYTGVTNNLIRRIWEHKQELVKGFTSKYHLHKLLYFEVVDGQLQAIVREKQIKDMNRADKLDMIRNINPKFEDLYDKILDPSTVLRASPSILFRASPSIVLRASKPE